MRRGQGGDRKAPLSLPQERTPCARRKHIQKGKNSMNASISAIADGTLRQMLHHPQAHAAVVVRTLPLFHNRLVRRDA